MTDAATLTALLTEAKEAMTPRAARTRVLSGAPLAATLREIDETFLPRLLRFELGEAQLLVIRTAERRLIAVTEAEPQALLGEFAALLAPNSDAAKSDRIAAVSSLLERFCEADGALSVTSDPPGMEDDHMLSEGISVEELRAACGIDAANFASETDPENLPPAAPDVAQVIDPKSFPSAPQAFFAACAHLARGAVCLSPEGKVLASSGEGALVPIAEIAKVCAKHFAANSDTTDRVLPGTRLVVLRTALPDLPAIASVMSGEEFVAATISAEHLGATLAEWQRIDAAFQSA